MTSSRETCSEAGVIDSDAWDAIFDCERASNSSFCYPLEGARFCVPARSRLRVFWQTDYYERGSDIALTHDLNATLNYTTNEGMERLDLNDIWSQIYDKPTNESKTERSFRIHMLEKVVESTPVITHPGPRITLVNTALPSMTIYPGYRPTYSSTSRNSDEDDKRGLNVPATVFGVVFSCILFLLLIKWCCCGSGAGRSVADKRASRSDTEAQSQYHHRPPSQPSRTPGDDAEAIARRVYAEGLANTRAGAQLPPRDEVERRAYERLWGPWTGEPQRPTVVAAAASQQQVEVEEARTERPPVHREVTDDGQEAPPPYSEPPPRYSP
ncbi:hypothetical protein BS50DRAFT_676011 [Corynespora cassiicola Philippines]|uniref:Uncharacterized protein n=1 Tax=Corynespora cassiicola Philippines TaxID=1448308 RepID=A0A2T2NRI5_CORCC|nr:hypothetical protein BS50DRAFT_676011 [Corynespora cassiicola Philippines]